MADFKGPFLSSDAQALGIISSLTVHACLFALLFLLPASKLPSITRTIHISLGQQDSFSSAATPADSGPADSKPAPIRKKSPSSSHQANIAPEDRPEPAAAEANTGTPAQWNTPPVAHGGALPSGPAPALENAGRVNAVSNSAGSSGGTAVVEARFGTSGAPAFAHREVPVYPPLARRLGKEGRVVLRLLIDQNGKLKDIEVMEADGFGFLESAVAAVRQSTFRPARKNGEAVAAKAILPVRFRLEYD
jgi:protein TonB